MRSEEQQIQSESLPEFRQKEQLSLIIKELTALLNIIMETLRESAVKTLNQSNLAENQTQGAIKSLVKLLFEYATNQSVKPVLSGNIEIKANKYVVFLKILLETYKNNNASPYHILKNLFNLKNQAEKLSNNKPLVKKLRRLEQYMKQHADAIKFSAEQRFMLLVQDMESMVNLNYHKISFKNLDYKCSFFYESVKVFVARHKVRESQVAFLQLLIKRTKEAEAKNKKQLGTNGNLDETYDKLSQQLIAGLMFVKYDIDQEKGNRLVSKLGKITEHCIKKHHSDSRVNKGFVRNQLMSSRGSLVSSVAKEVNYNLKDKVIPKPIYITI